MSPLLVVNSIVEWPSDDEKQGPYQERILWIDPISRCVVTICISISRALPVMKTSGELEEALEEEAAFRRTIDPFAYVSDPDAVFWEKHRGRMEKAWKIIEDLVEQEPNIYLPNERGPLIRRTAKAHGVTEKVIYGHLKRYWVCGKIKYALLPNYQNCGAPGQDRLIVAPNHEIPKRGRPTLIQQLDADCTGVNVDEVTKKIFEMAIRLYYDTRKKHPLKLAYKEMCEAHFNLGYTVKDGVQVPVLPPPSEYPTYGQFRYWFRKKKKISTSIIKRDGVRVYNLKHRPVLGNSTQMAIGPGSIFQVDATIGDVYLVSRLNRNWIIGRPVIYFVVDVFSRMVAGLYVGLEGPSWLSGMMAMAQATTDKISYCARYGIEIDADAWPCSFLPVSVLADRGEFLGLNSDAIPGALNIQLANCPPYRADWKGIVEQMFRIVNNETIHWLPGRVRGRERGEKDHRLDATLDLYQFTKIIINFTLEYNLHHCVADYPMEPDMISDDVQPVPIELWNWGISNRAGHLQEKSADIIKLSLMPKGQASVTSMGIKFKGLYYSTERAIREDWYAKARSQGRWRVEVSYDPRVRHTIYLRQGTNQLEPCYLLKKDERFEGFFLEELQDYFELEKIAQKKREHGQRQSNAEVRAKNQSIENEAIQMKKEAADSSLSNHQRIQGIGSHRSNEKEFNRGEEGFNLRPEGDRNQPASVHLIKTENEESAHITAAMKKKNSLEILKGLSDEGQQDD